MMNTIVQSFTDCSFKHVTLTFSVHTRYQISMQTQIFSVTKIEEDSARIVAPNIIILMFDVPAYHWT